MLCYYCMNCMVCECMKNREKHIPISCFHFMKKKKIGQIFTALPCIFHSVGLSLDLTKDRSGCWVWTDFSQTRAFHRDVAASTLWRNQQNYSILLTYSKLPNSTYPPKFFIGFCYSFFLRNHIFFHNRKTFQNILKITIYH